MCISAVDVCFQVASLVRDVSFLNSSMVRMDNVSQQVESFRTILNSLSSRLDELARLNGDAVHNNTYFQDTIQGFADRILQLEVCTCCMLDKLFHNVVLERKKKLSQNYKQILHVHFSSSLGTYFPIEFFVVSHNFKFDY